MSVGDGGVVELQPHCAFRQGADGLWSIGCLLRLYFIGLNRTAPPETRVPQLHRTDFRVEHGLWCQHRRSEIGLHLESLCVSVWRQRQDGVGSNVATRCQRRPAGLFWQARCRCLPRGNRATLPASVPAAAASQRRAASPPSIGAVEKILSRCTTEKTPTNTP